MPTPTPIGVRVNQARAEQPDREQPRDCPTCRGTGEGQVEGLNCPTCRGRGFFGPR